MKKMFEFTRALLLTLIFAMFFSCANNDVDKVNVDNQFAVSLFSGTVKVGDLLGGIGSGLSEYIQVSENGRIYAYYADSVENAVVATNILTGIQDVTFQTSAEFELPEIPGLSDIPGVDVPDIDIPDIDIPGILDSLDIPDTPEIPDISIDSVVVFTFNDFVSIPFEYDGYEINFVELKNGRLYLNLSTSLIQLKNVVLSTDNIRLGDGSSLELNLDFTQGQKQYIDFDLTNCVIAPENKNITFSAILSLDIPLDQGLEGGLYTVDLNGGIMDVEFKTIDGKINDFVFDFVGSHDFDFSIPNMSGALKIATPDFSIKYINTFGFKANGTIDSLYLSGTNGNISSLIKDGERVDLFLHPTGESYDSISELDEKLVDEINILQGFNKLTFNGDIVLSCDEVTENMITDESHIDIIADLAIPLEFEMENLSYVNKFDFNLDLNSEENSESMQLGNVFDELEFKFVFNNTIPVQIRPQVYVLENGNVIDSLFNNEACIHGKFDNSNSIPEDILIVNVTGKKLENVQLADQLMLDITLSTEGERVVLNTNDYFDIRIGLKTKTSEINLSELNF